VNGYPLHAVIVATSASTNALPASPWLAEDQDLEAREVVMEVSWRLMARPSSRVNSKSAGCELL
jgi:hypothetical protein